MKITISLLVLMAIWVSGCNSKTPPEEESNKALEATLKPKNSTVYTYDQTVQKLNYEECLAKQKNNTDKGECHEPDFLKK
jgi:PBP1b-binding outer membrane lipoprotein LpoB